MLITREQMNYEFAKHVISVHRQPQGWVTVDFADQPKDMYIQHVLLHLPVWEILVALNLPVYQRHILYTGGSFSKSTYKKMLTVIYQEILEYNDTDLQRRFVDEAWKCINYTDDFGAWDLAEFHSTLSIIDLSEIMLSPPIKKITDVDLTNTHGTDIIEATLSDVRSKICKVFATPGILENDTLIDYQQADILNVNQIPQALVAFGLRTEVNDRVIPRAVKGSSLTGMHNIKDIVTETQAARKAAIMNHDSIRTSQYWGRKQQLISSTIAQIHREDCGAHKTIVQTFNTTSAKCYIGKNIILDDGRIVTLTHKNLKEYIDTPVNMITIGGCRHRDGVCATCAGALVNNISDGMNFGLVAATTLVEKVSQMILSTKHLIKTTSRVYQIPTGLSEFMVRTSKGIEFQPEYHAMCKDKEWYIGIDLDALYGGRSDLLVIDDEQHVPEERFSKITKLHFKHVRGSDTQIETFDAVVGAIPPFLAAEFILKMKELYNDTVIDNDIMWIPMKGVHNMPILRALIVNDSMPEYVNTVKSFLENKPLAKHKSFKLALEHFSELVWDKVSDMRITYLETLLRAHMITSSYDWRIPADADLENVVFRRTEKVIKNRTMSGMMSFQGHVKYFASPRAFVMPSTGGPFDAFYDLDKSWVKKK